MVMLGVRIDERLQWRMERMATLSKRSKSSLAREAMARFLDEIEGGPVSPPVPERSSRLYASPPAWMARGR
ncbi:MAG: hypothetical protein AAF205_03595 [Pseudomonadota bacterium]